MFTFSPLLGALSESSASQSILELDGGIKILVGVGWDESFDVAKLKELEKQVPTLSLILLTHATVEHIAAFAHCCKHFALFTRIPVYATSPIIGLGRTLLQDLYASTPAAATTIPSSPLDGVSYSDSDASSDFLLQAPTSDEIATYFSLVHPLKYSQPHQPLASPFSPPLNGLTITAYNSGHTLGGTIWHIQHGLESVVYAVDWNQGRENVYAGAAWLGGAGGGGAEVIEQLRKPTALVCSSRGGEKPSLSGGRGKRDELLLDKVKSCVTKGGTVLIPTDSSARVLELAYLLEHAWRADISSNESKLSSAKLYLAGRHVHSVMRYARSMLEWMDDNIVREFEAVTDGSRKPNGAADGTKQGKETGPFDFRYLRLLDRRGQVDKVLSRDSDGDGGALVGKVIIASDASLEWGFSKLALKQLAQDPVNMVILTEYPSLASESHPSLARTLWTWWKDQQGNATEGETRGDISQELDFTEYGKQALEGNDLVRYQQWLAQQRQLQTTLQGGAVATLETSGDVGDDVSESSSESEDSENEQQGRALNAATTLGQVGRKKAALTDQDLGVNILLKKKGVYDFPIREKKGRDRMFPHPVRRKRDDEYGEIIRPEDFLRAEEREDGDGADVGQFGKGDNYDNLGKKRKWDDAAPTNKGLGSHTNKRPMITRSITDEFPINLPDDGVDDELDAVPDDPDDAVNGPSKLVTTTGRISVKLQIDFVDFTGIHDKRSLHMLIPLIQPRKLILVGGSSDDTMTLASDCKKLMVEGSFDIYTPSMGTTIDASVDTNAWVVKLAPTLVKQLKWQSVRGLSIATVTGRLLARQNHPSPRTGDEDASNKRIKTEEAQSSEAAEVPGEPILDVLPMNMASASRSVAQPLHVGDLRLADLRKAMQQTGHTAEFRGEGTLVIDGSVMVRKTATGRIDVESIGLPLGGGLANQIGGTFYAVKRTIYENLAVVAGA
ncbi:beta-lactamase-like protein [Nemania sp. NC0429]|nr:beta-lactamase-like protein [Nemania sp. NC0429]